MLKNPDRTDDLKQKDKTYFWHPSVQMAEYAKSDSIIIARGEGYRLWDTDGNEYIDGNSGVWCVNLGYSQQRLVEAVARQVECLPYASLSAFSHEPAVELAARLAHLAPDPPGHVFYATSGAEAVEAAIKMSRQYFRQNGQATRHKIISLRGSYHGLTLGALSASGLTTQRRLYEPLPPGFALVEGVNCYRCPWNQRFPGCGLQCAAAIQKELSFHDIGNVAAVLIEPILASGGIHIPPLEYFKEVARIAREAGALLIIDEVTTGMGRTGRMFFFEHAGIQPDIFVISKGLTSGYQPLSAVIASKKVFDGFLGTRESGRAFLDFHTFGGHPAACATAIEVLNIYEETNLLAHVGKIGSYLHDHLIELQSRVPWIGDVRGVGLMYGLEFVDPSTGAPLEANRVRSIPRHAMKKGLIVRSLRDVGHVICLLPPLIIDANGVDALVSRLEAAIHDVLTDRR